MNKFMFHEHMKRLVSQFGEKTYTGERMALLWNIVKDATDESFIRFVDNSIMDLKYAPLGPEFREFMAGEAKQLAEAAQKTKLKDIQEGRACRYCGNDGLVLAINRHDGSQWAFLCSYCPTVERSGPGFRRMSTEKHEKQEIAVWDNRKYADHYQIVPLINHLVAVT